MGKRMVWGRIRRNQIPVAIIHDLICFSKGYCMAEKVRHTIIHAICGILIFGFLWGGFACAVCDSCPLSSCTEKVNIPKTGSIVAKIHCRFPLPCYFSSENMFLLPFITDRISNDNQTDFNLLTAIYGLGCDSMGSSGRISAMTFKVYRIPSPPIYRLHQALLC
jgi:hypothetical protein